MKLRLALLGIAALACGPLFAQDPVVGVADPEALFHDKDPKLNANKQVVMHIMIDLLEANHWNEAGKYLSDRYIQHNPNVKSGLAPVMAFFGSRKQSAVPAKGQWKTKIVAVLADGDLVMVATPREYPDPRDASKKYTTTWFDMWRIKDGKADEHWDSATIAAPNPNAKGK